MVCNSFDGIRSCRWFVCKYYHSKKGRVYDLLKLRCSGMLLAQIQMTCFVETYTETRYRLSQLSKISNCYLAWLARRQRPPFVGI